MMPVTAATTGPSRLRALDGMRGMGAVAVVFVHVWVYVTGDLYAPQSLGGFVVRELRLFLTMFFVLSGFLVFSPWVAAALEGRPAPRLGRYLKMRAARVLPLYWVTCAGAFIALADTGHRLLPEARELPVFALFGQTLFASTNGELNPPAWSLTVEVAFYAVLPLLGWAALRSARTRPSGARPRLLGLCGALVAVCLAVNASVVIAGLPVRVNSWMPALIGPFALGMAAASLTYGRPPRIPVAWTLLAAGLMLVIADGAWRASVGGDPVARIVRDLPAAAGWAMVIAAATAVPLRALACRPMCVLGSASYGIYLWHMPVLLALTARDALPERLLPAFGAVLAPTLALAVTTWVLVEHPALRLTRRRKFDPVARSSSAAVLVRTLGAALLVAVVITGASAASARATSGSVPLPRDLPGDRRSEAAAALRDPAVRAVLARLMVRDDRGREVFGGRARPERVGKDAARLSLPGTRAAHGARLRVDVDAVEPQLTAITIRPPSGVRARQVGLRVPISRGERLYGLGERFGRVELRGQVVENWAQDRHIDPDRHTSHSPMPLLLSSRGHGLLLDTNARARFDVGASTRDVVRIRADSGILRVWVIRAGTLKGVVGRAARLVGTPPLVPRWGLGVWKTLIGGERRVLADLARLRRAGVPLDAAWVYDLTDERSGVGWPWPIHRPTPRGPYPEPRALVDALHRRGLKVLGYLNPFVVEGRRTFDEAVENGLLVRGADGEPRLDTWRVSEGVRVRRGTVDLTHDRGRAWFGDRVRYAIGTLGLDGAMQDFGEGLPAGGQAQGPLRTALAHNRYPVQYADTVRRAAQQAKPDGTVFFSRAGYLGTQGTTTGRFTADQERSWDPSRGLPSALRAMLSGSLSGWPYWGPDIAGFTSAPDSVPDETELWTRWAQLGALSPVMRDMLGDQANGTVDALSSPETLAVFRAYARLHTALGPYLHRLARVAHEDGLPIVRPLFLEYPDDARAARIEDQYLLGPDVLVAPVLRPGVTERRVYLPAGQWTDYWSGRRLRGRRWVSARAPRRVIPLFVRSDADLTLPSPASLWAAPTAPDDCSALTSRPGTPARRRSPPTTSAPERPARTA